VLVGEGDPVAAGQVICVIEAMKMENEIAAPRDGVVTDLVVAIGQAISNGQLICVVAAE
jgi:biotin carboxyl carrier protein